MDSDEEDEDELDNGESQPSKTPAHSTIFKKEVYETATNLVFCVCVLISVL
jgi:hypothetical protein